MIITNTTSTGNNNIVALYPDQYVTEKEKAGPDWIKINVDYFTNVAQQQYFYNSREVVKNYRLLKGILTREDFYEEENTASFIETLAQDMSLPAHVKHYPILNPPINTMIGELSKRPDNHHVKAFDDDSRSEELQNKTDMLQQYILENAKNKIMAKIAQEQGITPEELMGSKEGADQVSQLTEKKVADYMTSYTSMAESWANHMIESLKMELKLKEKSEEAFRDLLVVSREFYQIYEDNSKLGFNARVLNPKNIWYLTTPDKKYSKDWYAGGSIEIMELSEVLNSFDLTLEEVDHLKKSDKGYQFNNVRESNLFNNKTGADTFTYDTYDPLVEQEKMIAESQLNQNNDALSSYMGVGGAVQSFGNKHTIVRGYWISKKKTGKLTYMDKQTNTPQTTLVDETYKKIPEEISIEWGYQNQWWEFTKIGREIYKCKPFIMLDYIPIIGVVHENKNTEAKSLVDLMKPFQVLYNICMNQLYSLFEKELGNVASISLRRIPKLKDGDDQDAIEAWEMMAKEKGIAFDDDSPENTKAPISNQTVARNIDLTRSQEIQSRYNAAVQLKNECWELVGFNRQRLGSVLATETATGTNAALTQSYAQTEPYFTQHEYNTNDFYQALLDTAQYIESTKPTSTISYINNEGEAQFIQVNGLDLKMKDLKVFVTSRAEDQRVFQELRALAQPMLQNGSSIYDVAVLYSTNSIRQMKDTFKKLKEQQEAMQQQQAQQKQQDLDQQQQQFQAAQAAAQQQHASDQANSNYQKELDRLNKKEVEIIRTFAKQPDNTKDMDANGIPDMLEVSRLTLDQNKADKDYQKETSKIALDKQKHTDEMKLQLEKVKIEREKLTAAKEMQDKQIAADITVAKYRDKGTKNSPKKK